MFESAKDILKSVKASMTGQSSKDIQFNDLRQNEKKISKKIKKDSESERKSDIMQNEEGFIITDTGTKFCDYGEIYKKGKKKRIKEKETLEEWGAFDFYRFAHSLYLKKYKDEWHLKIGGSSLEINRIRDKVHDIFGFCCNLIMYDYIVFFFDNYIDRFIKEKEKFYFSQMRCEWVLKSFEEHYDFKDRFAEYSRIEKQKNKKYILTDESVRDAFLLGDTTLVGNYGVVISLNWLLKVKKMPKKQAVKLVITACKDLHKRDMIEMVKKSTETFSPYPDNLLFSSPQLIFNKIDKSINLNVEFNAKKKIDFL
jgi:hypothetical protein